MGTEDFSTRKYFLQVQLILCLVNTDNVTLILASHWSELEVDGVHTLLTPEELHFVFGTKDHSLVSKEEYSVVAIRDTLQQDREDAKRAGWKKIV